MNADRTHQITILKNLIWLWQVMGSWLKNRIEYAITGVISLLLFFLVIQPALAAIDPTFANGWPAQAALVVTILVSSGIYAVATEYTSGGVHYLFVSVYPQNDFATLS
jgi:hypothetical protein